MVMPSHIYIHRFFLCAIILLVTAVIPTLLVYAAITTSPAGSPSSRCNYTAQVCGNLTIPYPFGMSEECGLPEYRISCKRNSSYGDGDFAFLQNISSPSELQVLHFYTNPSDLLVNATDLKAMPSPDNCDNDTYFAETLLQFPVDGPFVFSAANYFAVIGCRSQGRGEFSIGNVSKYIYDSVSSTAGCYNQYGFGYCNFYSCSVNGILAGIRGLKLYGNGISYEDFPDVCGFSMLLYPPSYSNPDKGGIFAAGQYGILLSWGLKLSQGSQNCSNINATDSYACHEDAVCSDVSVVDSLHAYACSCRSGYSGDGYRDAIGCHDIDECSSKDLNTCVGEPAGMCINRNGSYVCGCGSGYVGDGNSTGTGCKDVDECSEESHDCDRPPRGICINLPGSYNCTCAARYVGDGKRGNCKQAGVVLPAVLGGLGGAAILVVFILVACGSRRAYLVRRRRSENFQKNGGEELVQERSMVFSEEELRRATDNFSRKRELGKGGFGTVYWGVLPPPHGKVAIKRAKFMADGEMEAEQVKSFVTEICTLGKVRHANVVRLLGCCVETRVPLLVYEFVENGSVWDHLHSPEYGGKRKISPLSRNWWRRLDIAVGTASAVSHLHSMEAPILHRDVKSANILLDASFNAKVADFGASCSLSSGATHLTFANGAVGTPGYLDPEISNTWRVTDRSDVYSFGVVLLELLTGKRSDLGPLLGFLSHHFKEVFREGGLGRIVDPNLVTDDGDGSIMASVEEVAELAMGCLATEGRGRPTMKEVWWRLKEIQGRMKEEVMGNDKQVVEPFYVSMASDDVGDSPSMELVTNREMRRQESSSLLSTG